MSVYQFSFSMTYFFTLLDFTDVHFIFNLYSMLYILMAAVDIISSSPRMTQLFLWLPVSSIE